MKTQTETQTIAQFIEAQGLTMYATPIASRPDRVNFGKGVSHWAITIYKGGNGTGKGPQTGSMALLYSMGSAHKGSPKIADVLNCIALDASGIEGNGFENWCGEYGCDTDSRKAYATFEACQKSARDLRSLLNDAEAFEALLYSVERL